jgi:tRNA1(Val) A37 N6-methylase TrmN6
MQYHIRDFTINYDSELDGGGSWITPVFLNFMQQNFYNIHFDECLEWCSGPAFMGMSLLVNNFCKKLCVTDMYQPAIDTVISNVNNTNYEHLVKTYCIDKIALLPQTEMFDLIVANPPHFASSNFYLDNVLTTGQRIYVDKNWKTHVEFFTNIASHLKPNGKIVLVESAWGCNADTFNAVINSVNLKVSHCQYEGYFNQVYPLLFIVVEHNQG